jgi:hypothetical protein
MGMEFNFKDYQFFILRLLLWNIVNQHDVVSKASLGSFIRDDSLKLCLQDFITREKNYELW